MNIAIVDDLELERTKVRNIITEYFSKNQKHSKLKIDFYEFKSGEDFLKSLNIINPQSMESTERTNIIKHQNTERTNTIKHQSTERTNTIKHQSTDDSSITKPPSMEEYNATFPPTTEGYDLVILDIYMEELSGIEVAKKLHQVYKNCNIILFTSSTEHMLDGYEVSAIGYVLKPVDEHKHLLYNALKRAIERLSPDDEGISIHTKYGENYILYKNLIFVDSSLRNLYFHFQKENLLVSGKYTDYADFLLRDKRFLECYRNLIVNMDYIETVSESNFILTNGENIPISRRKKSEVMEKYTKYFIEKRCNTQNTYTRKA